MSAKEKLYKITKKNIKEYGAATVEDRAIPDYRDGLKPVQRRIIWAMSQLGLRPSGGFVKSARVVGQVIGLYHPHGDQAAYQAMVNMANSPQPTVFGEGNWGGPLDSAAAYRYTEAKLTQYSQDYLVDPVYLKVAEYLPNFDGSEKEPLILPAKLPNLLLNGASGIAVAVTTRIPAFEKKGVLALVNKALNGKEITAEDCVKHLKFTAPWNGSGKLVSEKKEVSSFFQDGKGSLSFRPYRKIDAYKGTYTLKSAVFGLNLSLIQENMMKKDEVLSVSDMADAKNPVNLVITLKAGKRRDSEEIFEKYDKLFSRRVAYHINVTERLMGDEDEHKVLFRQTTVPEIIQDWVKWRVALEIKVLNYLKEQVESQLAYQDLIISAIRNLDALIKTIRRKHANRDALLKSVAKLLKVEVEKAATVLALSLNSLSNLSEGDTRNKIKNLKKELKEIKGHLAKPNQRILDSLKGGI